jgi:hypothetical protein
MIVIYLLACVDFKLIISMQPVVLLFLYIYLFTLTKALSSHLLLNDKMFSSIWMSNGKLLDVIHIY